MTNRKPRALRRALLVGLVLMGLVSVCLTGYVWYLAMEPTVRDYLSRTDFDSAGWREASLQSGDPMRLRMVDDLLRDHELDGMSTKEVEALLGPADETAKRDGWDLVYWLGPERNFISIDSEWLILRLDDDHVCEYRLVTD